MRSFRRPAEVFEQLGREFHFGACLVGPASVEVLPLLFHDLVVALVLVAAFVVVGFVVKTDGTMKRGVILFASKPKS